MITWYEFIHQGPENILTDIQCPICGEQIYVQPKSNYNYFWCRCGWDGTTSDTLRPPVATNHPIDKESHT